MTIPDDPPKLEIGYDLDKDHTGKQGGKFTTAEGELLSNYMENGDSLNTQFPPTK